METISDRFNSLYILFLCVYCVSIKGSDECEPRFTVIPGHSACLSPAINVVTSGVTEADKNDIVNLHNKLRSEVNPSATDMMKMSWDSDVALVAQKWAENCIIDHDNYYHRIIPGRFNTGQNLAWGSYRLGFNASIQLWYDEVKDFKTTGNNVLAQVGHYTQVVWANSIKIGCGYAQCGPTHYYVCNYSPAGNSDINKPYTFGSSCAACSGQCENNLCNCNGLVCQNWGTLNKAACSCSCQNVPHYINEDCDLDCSKLQDPGYCSQFGVGGCSAYSNVPFECPGMCNICNFTASPVDSTSVATSTTTPHSSSPTTSTHSSSPTTTTHSSSPSTTTHSSSPTTSRSSSLTSSNRLPSTTTSHSTSSTTTSNRASSTTHYASSSTSSHSSSTTRRSTNPITTPSSLQGASGCSKAVQSSLCVIVYLLNFLLSFLILDNYFGQ